jgi:hypothetical protein
MTDSGIVLLKYWLEVGPDEQTRRLESRIMEERDHDQHNGRAPLLDHQRDDRRPDRVSRM